jgi:hypothetical protein
MWWICCIAGVACLGAALPSGAGASVPSVAECLEASDFIANAAQSRDNGVTREAFMRRLEGDLTAIHSFPAGLRWFAHDEADERFLTLAASQVFDDPADPETHRANFLRACFARLQEGSGDRV